MLVILFSLYFTQIFHNACRSKDRFILKMHFYLLSSSLRNEEEEKKEIASGDSEDVYLLSKYNA